MKKWLYISVVLTAIQVVSFGQSKPNPFDVYRGTQNVPSELLHKAVPPIDAIQISNSPTKIFKLEVENDPKPKLAVKNEVASMSISKNSEESTEEFLINTVAPPKDDSISIIEKDTLSDQQVTSQIDRVVVPGINPFDVDTTYTYDTNRAPINRKRSDELRDSNKKSIAGNNQFSIGIYLLSLVILALAISQRRRTFRKMFRGLVNNNVLLGIRRDENEGNSFFLNLLLVMYLLVISLFATQVYTYYRSESGFVLFLKILGVSTLIYLLRYITMSVLDFVISGSKIARDHRFSVTFHNIITGILLLPVSMLLQYTQFKQELVYTGIAIIFILFAIRQIKGLLLALFDKDIELFHFFLYLCAVELAPILFFMKYFGII